MSVTADTQDFIERFRYQADGADRWSLIEDSARGDCEDFALTVLWIRAGRSWLRLFWMVLTMRAMLWHTRSGGRGHVMLWVAGRGWIDNVFPSWSHSPRHPRIYPIIAPLLALKILLKR